jgi:uncharacterized protein (TIGR01777 family)
MIGTALLRALRAAGAETLPASRSDQPASRSDQPASLRWRPEADHPFADLAPLENLDAAIHLSGANLAARRWTPAYKKEIVSSRTVTTSALARVLASLQAPPPVLLSASATGIYGDRGDEVLDEDSLPGTGFLPDTCQAWEAATVACRQAGIRVAHLRFGVVLDPAGGALAKMLPLFRGGLGGRLGSGREWMSWITLPDLVAAVLHLLTAPTATGAFNFVAPEPVTNAQFTRALGAALHRPTLFPAPAFALRLAFGEMADAALLASCRALPRRLPATGFAFAHPQIDAALQALLQP